MSGPHVVLGATGGAGQAITRALAAAAVPVRAVSRHDPGPLPDGARHQRADISTAEGAAAAVAGAAVVVMAAQPPYHRWPQQFPAMLERVATACTAVGAKLVMVDNCYAYGPVDGPMTERTPMAATDAKGVVRRDMARRLLAAHADGHLRVAIGRASDYIGPGVVNSGIAALAIEPLRRSGGRLRWIGRDDVAHSVALSDDVAAGIVALCLDDRADGHAWHLPHAPAATGAEVLGMVNACLDVPRRTGLITPWQLRLAAPLARTAREAVGTLHQWVRPFVVDDAAMRATFGVTATPLEAAVERSVAHVLGAVPAGRTR